MTTETRNLPEFTSVSLEGHGDLTLIHGSTPSIVIETDPETLEHLKVEVENGRLVLGMKSWLDHLFHSWKKVNYTVTYTSLEAISVSGSGKVKADQVMSDRFKFHISGSGSFTTTTGNHQRTGSSHIRFSQYRPGRYDTTRRAAYQRQRQSHRPRFGVPVRACAHQRFGRFGTQCHRRTGCLHQRQWVRALPGQPKISQSISGSGSIKQLAIKRPAPRDGVVRLDARAGISGIPWPPARVTLQGSSSSHSGKVVGRSGPRRSYLPQTPPGPTSLQRGAAWYGRQSPTGPLDLESQIPRAPAPQKAAGGAASGRLLPPARRPPPRSERPPAGGCWESPR